MDINALQNYYRIQNPTNVGRVGRTNSEATGTDSDKIRTDKVDISSQGSFKAQLAACAKSYASQSASTASPERIAQLKQQYSADACPVSGTDIAGSVMRYILGASGSSI